MRGLVGYRASRDYISAQGLPSMCMCFADSAICRFTNKETSVKASFEGIWLDLRRKVKVVVSGHEPTHVTFTRRRHMFGGERKHALN